MPILVWMRDDAACYPDLKRLSAIWRIEKIPRNLSADFALEIRRRIREGAYDNARVFDQLAEAIVRSGDL